MVTPTSGARKAGSERGSKPDTLWSSWRHSKLAGPSQPEQSPGRSAAGAFTCTVSQGAARCARIRLTGSVDEAPCSVCLPPGHRADEGIEAAGSPAKNYGGPDAEEADRFGGKALQDPRALVAQDHRSNERLPFQARQDPGGVHLAQPSRNRRGLPRPAGQNGDPLPRG